MARLPRSKIFNDAIHGHIDIHAACVAIIDTPEFQRLRDLKQLGGVYLVFPMASHNRFEHSIGVSFLAGQFAEMLQKNQPELEITDEEVLCCKIAGLCHDLGHGVLSHGFDVFMRSPAVNETDWTHEKGSLLMIDHLLKQNPACFTSLTCYFLPYVMMIRTYKDVWSVLQHYKLDTAHLTFIKELILGSVDEAPQSWRWKGRPGKEFLFQIVANKINGIDVDKFDYFARDAHNLGMAISFDAHRLMRFARAMEFDGRLQICFHEKEAWNIYELFHTRYNLHKRAYQHRVASAGEMMMIEAMIEGDRAGFRPLVSSDGRKMLKISEATSDMTAYTALTDSVLRRLQFAPGPQFAHARSLLTRVNRRQLYDLVGECLLEPQQRIPRLKRDAFVATMKNTIVNWAKRVCPPSPPQRKRPRSTVANSRPLRAEDLIIRFVHINYGMQDANPVDMVGFFSREHGSSIEDSQFTNSNDRFRESYSTPARIPPERVSCLIPKVFSEQYLRLFVKSHELLPQAIAGWRHWCKSKRFSTTPKRPRKTLILSEASRAKSRRAWSAPVAASKQPHATFHAPSHSTTVPSRASPHRIDQPESATIANPRSSGNSSSQGGETTAASVSLATSLLQPRVSAPSKRPPAALKKDLGQGLPSLQKTANDQVADSKVTIAASDAVKRLAESRHAKVKEYQARLEARVRQLQSRAGKR